MLKKRVLSVLAAVVFMLTPLTVAVKAEKDVPEGQQVYDLKDYGEYSASNAKAPRPKVTLTAGVENIVDYSADITFGEHNKESNVAIVKENNRYLVFDVEVEQTGMYRMALCYSQITESQPLAITVDILIDGEIPHTSSNGVILNRYWDQNRTEKDYDKRGNELLATQEEYSHWVEQPLYDCERIYNDPLEFYLKKGSHKITVDFANAGVAVKYLKLYNENAPKKYSEVKKGYESAGYKKASGVLDIYEAEDYLYKSDSTISIEFDKSDPATTPNDVSKLIYNTIGGSSWKDNGQKITYEIDVKETGLYNITLKVRQNEKSGFFSTRRLYIDGKVPFEECNDIRFEFKNGWYNREIGNGKEPYLFYLEKGKHTLTLEVAPGVLSQTYVDCMNTLTDLNAIYRKVNMIVGSSNDKYRDYYLTKDIPDLVDELKKMRKELIAQRDSIAAHSGKSGGETATLQTMITQLDKFIKDPDDLALKLENFNSNISSLAAWADTLTEQPLEMDYLVISSPEKDAPKATAGFFKKLWFAILRLFASFGKNYGIVGDNADTTNTVKVWVSVGQEQMEVMNDLINKNFHEVPVKLELVSVGLLEAVMAGKGPDVSLFVASDVPVNLAARGAVANLSELDGYDEVVKDFMPSAIKPLQYRGDTYALPLTQNYEMLFVREDIFEQMKLEVPTTWDELSLVAPVLQRNNMMIGINSSFSTFATLLYQNGGNIYNQELNATQFEDEAAIEAFKTWTDFFTKYSFPVQYDFFNRFRSGEMPIGVASYSMYAMLETAAPELKGLWKMYEMPGTVYEDRIDRTSVAGAMGTVGINQGITSAIILKDCKNIDGAWKFVKWLVSSETQAEYGNTLETVMGVAARYDTANIKAFERLPWKEEERETLMRQWENVKTFEEIPGSYYVTRHMTNAFRQVVYYYENPVHTLCKYNVYINKELLRKSEQFGSNR